MVFDMAKERLMAVMIGGLLLFSVVGFAFIGMGRFAGNENRQIQVPNIINEYLSGEQVSSILRSGRVLIRNVYTKDCADCMARDASLEIFVNSFPGIIVLEEMMIEPDNTTAVDENGYVKFEMISPTGEIRELNGKELSQKELTDIFCEISAIQPKECLLMDIVNQKPLVQPDDIVNVTGDNETTGDATAANEPAMNETNTTPNDTVGIGLNETESAS